MEQPNDLFPSSPTISSVSSSDLDTESTGSFFHDRSITLGTLMGVSFPPMSVRVSSRRESSASASDAADAARRSKKHVADRRRHHGRRWWSLCREDSRAPSLADYLEIERRFGDASDNRFLSEHEVAGGAALFADGRVLPPPPPPPSPGVRSPAPGACGFPVVFSGICCGGGE